MNSGSAPPADGPQNSSSTTPTDSRTSEPSSTVFPISTDRLADLLGQMYRYGWELSRSLPGLETPVEIGFQVSVNRENQHVDVSIRVP